MMLYSIRPVLDNVPCFLQRKEELAVKELVAQIVAETYFALARWRRALERALERGSS